jgi:hypothetical protein
MKKLLLMSLLLALAGCVTYYEPQVAIEDGVYYAEDDPAYINNAYSYSSVYYPWSSMDYFYLGYGPYGGYGYGYSLWYDPWYYPMYSYYSPWYGPYRSHYRHAHHRRWNRSDRNCRHNRGCGNGDRRYQDQRDQDRYVGSEHTDRRTGRAIEEDGIDNEAERPDRRNGDNSDGVEDNTAVRRYVSTPPSGSSGNQGVVVRNREASKRGRARIDPVEPEVLVSAATSSSTETTSDDSDSDIYRYEPVTDHRSRQGGTEVRYRSGSKQGPAKTTSASAKGSGLAKSQTQPIVMKSASNTGGNSGKTSTTRSPSMRSNASRSRSGFSASGHTGSSKSSRSSSSSGRSGYSRSVSRTSSERSER